MFRTHNHERGNDKNKQKNNNVPRFTSMQILPPASSLLRPAPGLSGAAKVRPVAMPPLTKRTTTTTTTMTSNAEQLRSGWTVGVLEPIPMIYVLERTHVFVNESADMIANRIAECLRLGSMVASYHKQEVCVHTAFYTRLVFFLGTFPKKFFQMLLIFLVVDPIFCCFSSFCFA